ncbi:hypothetical protein PV721_14080 [Streptomyces sp. MB09-01]|uniref:hypothetical protein n=1 Tax=Streptomyces sp. MB09-01 TaxID=3028666 RepID=UPI0029B320A0|nr:hypothetical protein [Streptomyces sp. MB09-01]MDX3535475.1 hypothetical protein [Streptomyces sp. MB09-01]
MAFLLVGTGLSGCSLLPPFETCEGTEEAVAELDELPALALRPEGAVSVGGGPWAGSSCVDDTAGAWLSAQRLYAYSGTREEVLEYYGREAPVAGWRPVRDLDTGPDGRIAVFCFESADRPSITLAFDSPKMLREIYGVEPDSGALLGVEARTWFSLSAEAAPDGSRTTCY